MTWNDTLVIAAVLVFVGKAIDWGLRQAHKERLLTILSEQEAKLKSFPIRRWEQEIASRGLRLYDAIGEVLSGERSFWLLKGMLRPVIALLFVGGTAHVVVEQVAPDVPVFFVAPYLLSAMAAVLYGVAGRWLGERVRLAYTWLFRLLIISAVLSSMALTVGANIVESLDASYWFNTDARRDVLDKQAILALLNVPFDALTILISYALLKLSISKSVSLVLVAVIDIVASLVLSIALFCLIGLVASEPAFSNICETLDTIATILSGKQAMTVDSLALIPLLLTTAVPVAAYMSVFCFTGLVLRPLAKLSAYLCGLLGEKTNSPFLELAVLISMIVAATKAILEWERIPELFR